MKMRPLVLLAPDAPATAAPPAPPKPAAAAQASSSPPPPPTAADMAEIDAAFTKSGAFDIPPKTPPEPTPAPKPAGGDVKPTPAAAPPSPDPKKPAAATPPAPPAEPQKTPKELRARLDTVESDLKEAVKVKTDLLAKIADFEKKGKDTDALRGLLDTAQKELNQVRGELRAARQEVSPEFKKQYEEPINQAIANAQRAATRLEKADGTPVDFWKEIAPIHQLMKKSWNKADAAAIEMFGESGGRMIMHHLETIDGLETVQAQALEKEKAGWAEKVKTEEGQRVQAQEAWKKNQELVEKDLEDTVEQYRDPVDDKELISSRQRGRELWEYKVKSAEEAHRKTAHVKHRFLSFEPNQLTIKRQAAKIAELEAEIKTLKPGQPNPDPSKPGGGEPTPTEEPWEVTARKTLSNVV